MPTRDEWIALAVVLGAVAAVGIAVYVLSRRKSSPKHVQLKRVQPQVVFKNLEEREILRDREGNLKKIVIHRRVERVE